MNTTLRLLKPCGCHDPVAFGHAGCSLGPRWMAQQARQQADRERLIATLVAGDPRRAWMVAELTHPEEASAH